MFIVLLTLRVRALYRNVRWVLWVVWIAFALFQALRWATILYGQALVYGEVSLSQLYQQTDIMFAENIDYSPINRTCEVPHVRSQLTAFTFIGLLPTLFDLMLLVLTALKALMSPTSLKTNTIVRVESRLSP